MMQNECEQSMTAISQKCRNEMYYFVWKFKINEHSKGVKYSLVVKMLDIRA